MKIGEQQTMAGDEYKEIEKDEKRSLPSSTANEVSYSLRSPLSATPSCVASSSTSCRSIPMKFACPWEDEEEKGSGIGVTRLPSDLTQRVVYLPPSLCSCGCSWSCLRPTTSSRLPVTELDLGRKTTTTRKMRRRMRRMRRCLDGSDCYGRLIFIYLPLASCLLITCLFVHLSRQVRRTRHCRHECLFVSLYLSRRILVLVLYISLSLSFCLVVSVCLYVCLYHCLCILFVTLK